MNAAAPSHRACGCRYRTFEFGGNSWRSRHTCDPAGVASGEAVHPRANQAHYPFKLQEWCPSARGQASARSRHPLRAAEGDKKGGGLRGHRQPTGAGKCAEAELRRGEQHDRRGLRGEAEAVHRRADARQQEMRQLIEEATKAQAEQMRTLMGEHYAEVLGNKNHHKVLTVLLDKDCQLADQQDILTALKQTNASLRQEQMR